MAEERSETCVITMSADHGRIVLAHPERLTDADVDDFAAWIEIVKRGMRRRTATDAGPGEAEGGRDGRGAEGGGDS